MRSITAVEKRLRFGHYGYGPTALRIHFPANMDRGGQYDVKGCLMWLSFHCIVIAFYTRTHLLRRVFFTAIVPLPIFHRRFSVPVLLQKTVDTENPPLCNVLSLSSIESRHHHPIPSFIKCPVHCRNSCIILSFPDCWPPLLKKSDFRYTPPCPLNEQLSTFLFFFLF